MKKTHYRERVAPPRKPAPLAPSRLVVLVSGAGTNLQALLDACAGDAYGARVVAVGADRGGIPALSRAQAAGITTFTKRVQDFGERTDWDRALTEACASFEPDLIVLAGFMKLVGPQFLGRFGGRVVNTHPSLLPSFPGMHGVSDALGHGVRVSGCTVFLVDSGTDSGPIIAQAAVPVFDDDDDTSLHERIMWPSGPCSSMRWAGLSGTDGPSRAGR
jgi:phosphoribosylglycinamide formyltransferase 1